MIKIHYVYLTTNLINGKQYVGDHTINTKNYIGSGRYFIKAIYKYGEQNFIKEILEWFDTREEAFDAQEKYIKQFNTLVPNGYNLSPKGGLRVKGCHSEETKQKISKKVSKTLTGRTLKESTKKILSDIMLAKKIKRSDDFKNNICIKNKNKKHTSESKNNMKLGHIGLIMPQRNKYTLISPDKIVFIFNGERELKKFIKTNKMSFGLIRNNYNNGPIIINRKIKSTLNTENWEIIKETLF